MHPEQTLSSVWPIGTVQVRGRAILAPLSGASDIAFRRIAARFGAGLVVTEMVAAEAFLRGEEEARLRFAGRGLAPHVVQLVGREPLAMADAARLAEASGADIIDINMGCPAKRVTGGLAGSALMREPQLALRIIAAVSSAVRAPITVKMRLGWDETSRNASELAARAAELGARAVTVHGRTRRQFYTGSADWAAVGEVVAGSLMPVVANGDVVSLGTAKACLAASGAAAVMVGRAALGQHWIVGEIAAGLDARPYRPPSFEVRTAAAIEHYEALLSLYGREMGCRHARKHLAAYADRAAEAGFGLASADRAELVTSVNPARVVTLLGRLWDEPLSCAA